MLIKANMSHSLKTWEK